MTMELPVSPPALADMVASIVEDRDKAIRDAWLIPEVREAAVQAATAAVMTCPLPPASGQTASDRGGQIDWPVPFTGEKERARLRLRLWESLPELAWKISPGTPREPFSADGNVSRAEWTIRECGCCLTFLEGLREHVERLDGFEAAESFAIYVNEYADCLAVEAERLGIDCRAFHRLKFNPSQASLLEAMQLAAALQSKSLGVPATALSGNERASARQQFERKLPYIPHSLVLREFRDYVEKNSGPGVSEMRLATDFADGDLKKARGLAASLRRWRSRENAPEK